MTYTITVDVDELWENTYIKGRPYANTERTRRLGAAHLETARIFDSGKSYVVKTNPSYLFFKSDYYGKFVGNSRDCLAFTKTYLYHFKRYFDSIKAVGYDTDLSVLLIDVIDGGVYLSDGNRRIACIKALEKQKDIEVTVGNHAPWVNKALEFASCNLEKSYLISEGKKILYQPVLHPGLGEYNSKPFTDCYREAMDIILKICGNVERKKILDVGCCYGYYSFEFAKAGAYVMAVDADDLRIRLCDNLVRLHNMCWSNPLFLWNTVESYIGATNQTFDYTLMMNVFHHMYGENPSTAWKTLNKIADKSDKTLLTMASTYPRNVGSQEDLLGFILDNSIFEKGRDFGPTPPFNRHLLLFEK